MSFLRRFRRHRIIDCNAAQKRVLQTGGLRIVCPEDSDIQETLEDSSTEQMHSNRKKHKSV